MFDLREITKQHEELFPKATADSQLWKLEEEIQELAEAIQDNDKEHQIRELADIWIVCAGLFRWFPETAMSVYCRYIDASKQLEIEYDDIVKEVRRKWDVNTLRKWVWNGKTYEHIGKDGNE